MILVTARKIDRVVVRPGSTATVQSKPRSNSVRVVQSASLAPAPAGGIYPGIAGGTLSGHRAVRHDLSGQLIYAQPDSAAGAQVVGVTAGAAAIGEGVTVECSGEMEEAGWNWVEGPIYLAADGVLTQVPPSSGYVVLVGIAAGPTKMIVAPRLVARLI